MQTGSFGLIPGPTPSRRGKEAQSKFASAEVCVEVKEKVGRGKGHGQTGQGEGWDLPLAPRLDPNTIPNLGPLGLASAILQG